MLISGPIPIQPTFEEHILPLYILGPLRGHTPGRIDTPAGERPLLQGPNFELLLLNYPILLPEHILQLLDAILQEHDFLTMPTLDNFEFTVELVGALRQQFRERHETSVEVFFGLEEALARASFD